MLFFPLFVCLLGLAAKASAVLNGAQVTVCTSTYEPLSKCGPSNNSIEGFTGYELELFKEVAKYAEATGNQLSPGSWRFICFPMWSDVLEDLTKPRDGNTTGDPPICDMAIAGISATSARRAPPMSLKFSSRTYATGRRVMVYLPEETWLWLFLKPFDTSLWLVFFATSVVATLCIVVLEMNWSEQGVKGLTAKPMSALMHFSNVQWASSYMMLHGGFQLVPRSPQGRVVALGYAFVVLILINMYISSMTSILFARKLQPPIRSVADLSFRPTGIFVDDYEALSWPRLPLYNLINETWQDSTEEEAMLQRLRNGTYDGLLLDAVFVDYAAAGECEMYAVGELYLPVNLAIAFPSTTLDSEILPIDTYLGQLEAMGVMEKLADEYMRPQVKCKWTSDPMNPYSEHISLYQVGGLWIILGSCVAASFFWKGIIVLYRYVSAEMEKRKGAANPTLPTAGSADVEKRLRASHGGRTSSSVAGIDTSTASSAATTDEALQEVETDLKQVGRHIKHLPFVMAAAFDAKLAELRQDLYLRQQQQQQLRSKANSQDNTNHPGPSPARNGGGMEEHFPMLANQSNGGTMTECIAGHLHEQQVREGFKKSSVNASLGPMHGSGNIVIPGRESQHTHGNSSK